jgi:hypothetical protein
VHRPRNALKKPSNIGLMEQPPNRTCETFVSFRTPPRGSSLLSVEIESASACSRSFCNREDLLTGHIAAEWRINVRHFCQTCRRKVRRGCHFGDLESGEGEIRTSPVPFRRHGISSAEKLRSSTLGKCEKMPFFVVFLAYFGPLGFCQKSICQKTSQNLVGRFSSRLCGSLSKRG